MAHVIVVGSGIAGLVAALRANDRHRVTLVTKRELAAGSTRHAQGGIAAALFPDDSVEAHLDDTIRAGAGLVDEPAARVLCKEGPARIRDLIALGVDFDREQNASGERVFARGLEAAHSRARVLHAGGDATGAAIEAALIAAVRRSSVDVREFSFVSELVVRSGRVAGVETVMRSGERGLIEADAVVLASGGAGQLYRHTTNPIVATGDGTAAAMRAGAEMRDLEFYQFHPTALAAPGNFLISEAVRGEGAVLLDRTGRRFLLDIHADAELAPRDVVARAIATRMSEQGGVPVLLDATALGATFLADRFPSIDRACRRIGLDWSETPIPVTPAAHYWMGGVRTDIEGRSSIPGLFAVGEAACTGVHGANRLASNSLLEGLVFAWRVAERLDDDWPATASPAWEDAAGGIRFSRQELQRLAWNAIGLERSAPALATASATLDSWHVRGDSIDDLETRNLLQLARTIVAAAQAREESRGAHYRSDFPESDARIEQQEQRKAAFAC